MARDSRIAARNAKRAGALALVISAAIPLLAHARGFAENRHDRDDPLDAASRDERSVEPVRAARPASPETIARLSDEATAAYQAQLWDQAMDAFKAVVALEPDNAQGWLRIGNLHHRKKQWLAASMAYRKADSRSQRSASGDELRARALFNLAAVNLEMAEAAIEQAMALPSSDGRGASTGSGLVSTSLPQLRDQSGGLRARLEDSVRSAESAAMLRQEPVAPVLRTAPRSQRDERESVASAPVRPDRSQRAAHPIRFAPVGPPASPSAGTTSTGTTSTGTSATGTSATGTTPSRTTATAMGTAGSTVSPVQARVAATFPAAAAASVESTTAPALPPGWRGPTIEYLHGGPTR